MGTNNKCSVSLHLGTIQGHTVVPPLSTSGPVLYWFCGNRRKLSKFQSSHSLQKIHARHADLGGGLSGIVTSFCLSGMAKTVPLPRAGLRCSLRHAIDFGTPGVKHLTPGGQYLSLDATVSLEDLEREVLLPSFGGPLTTREVGTLFNFPAWLPSPFLSQGLDLHPPPLLGFSWVLDAVVPFLPHHLSLAGPSRPSLKVPAQASSTWLPTYAPSHVPSLDTSLSHDRVDPSLVAFKAAKSDGAQVPTHLWSSRVTLVLGSGRASDATLEALRTFLLVYACRQLFRSFRRFLCDTHGRFWAPCLRALRLSKRAQGAQTLSGGVPLSRQLSPADAEFLRDVEAGANALAHYMDSSWWKWKRGSRLFFWRWPQQLGRLAARDGFRVFVSKPLPRHPSKQRPPPKELRKWVAEKVCDVRAKEYIAEGQTLSFIDFFAVPKTVDSKGNVTEIRMVYNGTSCGLNDCVWAPNFWMPTPHTAAHQLDYNSYMIDIDLGESF